MHFVIVVEVDANAGFGNGGIERLAVGQELVEVAHESNGRFLKHFILHGHNRRNPTVGPDFHFDFHDQVNQGTHEKLALKYRIPDEAK